MNQTAVEWFSQELDKRHCVILNYPEYQKLLEQAKEMEKEQIENAHIDGGKNQRTAVKYYNETFKSE